MLRIVRRDEMLGERSPETDSRRIPKIRVGGTSWCTSDDANQQHIKLPHVA